MASPPTGGRFNSRSPSIKRIMQESRELSQCPDPTLTAAPLESNLFEWHFTLTGPPSSSYTDGIYHGRIVLPPSYPLRPPSFRFLTPSGRFETNREICLSISGHHEETWQPAWGIRTALCAIRAFMAGDAKGQVGGLDMHPQAREKLAKDSRHWRCATCGGRSNAEIIAECETTWRAAHPSQDPLAAAASDQSVPEELRLAFREDLGKDKPPETSPPSPTPTPPSAGPDGAAVKEPATAAPAPKPVRIPSPAAAAPAAVPPVAVPPVAVPAAVVPHAHAHTAAAAQPTTSRAHTPQSSRASPVAAAAPALRPPPPPLTVDSPPAWIDKAIIGLALALVVMLIKRMAGSVD